VCLCSPHTNSQLDAAEEGPEESHHAEELHAALVLHDELLTDVGDPVERRSPQDQEVPEQLLLSWGTGGDVSEGTSPSNLATSTRLMCSRLGSRWGGGGLTEALLPAEQDVGSHHAAHAQQTQPGPRIVDSLVPHQKKEPGQQQDHWDDKTVQQLSGRTDTQTQTDEVHHVGPETRKQQQRWEQWSGLSL